MDRVKELFGYFLAAMAMFSLLCAVYQAMNDRLGSSGTLTAIFLCSSFLLYLPQLETFKAFSVEVRLRQRLNEAEEILARLKALSIVSAKASYLTLAWGSRLGSPSAKDKQAVLDDVNKELDALGVGATQQTAIKKPLVDLIGVDLWSIYSRVLERFVTWKKSSLVNINNAEPTPETKAALAEYLKGESAWRRRTGGHGPFNNLKNYNLKEYLQAEIPRNLLDAQEIAEANKFSDEIGNLYDGCVQSGGYTSSAANYLDTYSDLSGYDAKMKEVFHVEYSKLP